MVFGGWALGEKYGAFMVIRGWNDNTELGAWDDLHARESSIQWHRAGANGHWAIGSNSRYSSHIMYDGSGHLTHLTLIWHHNLQSNIRFCCSSLILRDPYSGELSLL